MSDQLGPGPAEERAAQVVRLAQGGQLGDAGRDLVALFGESVERGRRAEAGQAAAIEDHAAIEREVNALAAVVAMIMDGRAVDDVVNMLPSDARRRVIAYRHRTGPLRDFAPRDQLGPLPEVPSARSVLRDSVRVYEP